MNNIAAKHALRTVALSLAVLLALMPTFLPTSAVAQSSAPSGFVSKNTIIAAYAPQGFKFGSAKYSPSTVKGYLPSWMLVGTKETDNDSDLIDIYTVSMANGIVGAFSINLDFPVSEFNAKVTEAQNAIDLVLSNWGDAHKWFTLAATESKALIDKGVATDTSLSKTFGDYYFSLDMTVNANDVSMRWHVSDSAAETGKRKASASALEATAPVAVVASTVATAVPAVASTTANAAPIASQNAGTIAGNGGYDCPPTHPIKGNIRKKDNAHIYHTPDDPNYKQTKPEACFATVADAVGAGFRAPLR